MVEGDFWLIEKLPLVDNLFFFFKARILFAMHVLFPRSRSEIQNTRTLVSLENRMKLYHNWKIYAINEYFPSLHYSFKDLSIINKKLKTLSSKTICMIFLEIPNVNLSQLRYLFRV